MTRLSLLLSALLAGCASVFIYFQGEERLQRTERLYAIVNMRRSQDRLMHMGILAFALKEYDEAIRLLNASIVVGEMTIAECNAFKELKQ